MRDEDWNKRREDLVGQVLGEPSSRADAEDPKPDEEGRGQTKTKAVLWKNPSSLNVGGRKGEAEIRGDRQAGAPISL